MIMKKLILPPKYLPARWRIPYVRLAQLVARRVVGGRIVFVKLFRR
jgi:hypothetical protein